MRTKSAAIVIARNITLLLLASFACITTDGFAQTSPNAAPAQKPFTAEPLPPGWDQIDERLVFLTIRLSSVETSVAAVDKALKATGYSKTQRTDDAEHAHKGNEIMDRKGGGPVPWQDFYGRTAQDFYFHPGTAVHAHAISGTLRESDVQAQHTDTPIAIERPPQLDYIYRANIDNQKRADAAAAELGGQIDKLLERRRGLESEQAALWSEIAFQAVASRDLSSKPLYRFSLKTTDPATDHTAAGNAACDFVRTVNQLMSDAQAGVENDPGQVFHQFAIAITAARKTLDDRLAEQESIALDLSDGQSKISKVTAAAKRLDDLAKNMDESYRLAHEGDAAGDDQRKNTFRGLLQDGLLNAADTLVTADQCVLEVVKDWKLRPDVKTPATQASAHIEMPAENTGPKVDAGGVPTAPSPSAQTPTSSEHSETPTAPDRPANAAPSNGADDLAVDLLSNMDLQHDVRSGEWKKDGTSLVGGNVNGGGHVFLPYLPKGDYDLTMRITRVEGDGSMEMYLSRDGSAAAFFSMSDHLSALSLDGNHTPLHHTPQSFQALRSGQAIEVTAKVRKDAVSFLVDGVELIKGRHGFASIKDGLLQKSGGRLVFGCWKCRCKIEQCTVETGKEK